VLTAYFDESGHETDNVIVAGFLGNDEQWDECALRWRAGLGNRKYLHVKELRFKRERDKRLLKRLGPIPHECGLRALLATVPVDSYHDLVSDSPAEKLTKGYYFCLMTIFDAIVKNTPKEEPVKLVFEAQDTYETQARRLFDVNKHHLTSSGGPKFSSIEFIPKDSSILTQPADYLAFFITQRFRDPESLKSQWCAPIGGNTQEAFGIVHDGRGLREVVESSFRKMPEMFAKGNGRNEK
jgi:hypothetical protein